MTTAADTREPWFGRRWLNPPGIAVDSRESVPVLLSLDAVGIVSELLDAERQRLDTAIEQAEAASTSAWLSDDEVVLREKRAIVGDVAADLEWAPVPPESAQISPEATCHPANQLARLMPAVLTQLTRWAGGRCVVSNAVAYAAAIEASRTGWAGVQDVASTAINAGDDATNTAYGTVEPPH